MARQIAGYLEGFLSIALAVSIILSADARSATHDFAELAKIVAEHHSEIEEHGHAHEDVVNLMHAYHGHGHDVADHDHNIAFLSPREAMSTPFPTSASWAMADHGLTDRRDYGLDRPPRV
ncbi:MAG: hypothetical protein AAFY74_05395 [Pseudomonadota bacterium]